MILLLLCRILLATVYCLFIASSSASAIELRDFINKQNCDQILDKGFYQICYNYHDKGALYVGYTLSGKKVDSGNIKKRPRFYPDRAVPGHYRTKPSDYTRNEFHSDRGHLAPDAAFDYSKQALHSVYSMANIIPQYKWINRKTWVKAEKYARQMARKLGTVAVINGVVYGPSPKHMKKSGIAYPDAYWKMLYDNHGFERCFYYKNDRHAKIKGDKLRNHVVDCSLVNDHRPGQWPSVAHKSHPAPKRS